MTERYLNPHTDFGFTRLFEQAEIAKFDPDELKTYEDIVNAIKTAEKKKYAEGVVEGLAKGMAKGRIEGRAEGRAEVAKKMLAKGIPAETLTELTGLTKDEIKAL